MCVMGFVAFWQQLSLLYMIFGNWDVIIRLGECSVFSCDDISDFSVFCRLMNC